MSERKIFAGPRIRRIRNERGLTQTAMAEALGISPSYLNLIERNQRPLTVQLLLKLASVYKLNLDSLQAESGSTITGLKEVFSDPLLTGELPGDQELVEIGEAAPNAAVGIMKLYRAYREQQQRLSDLSQLLSHEGSGAELSATRLPLDEVRDVMARRANHYPRIEEEAESFYALLKPEGDLSGALKEWLRREHGITVRTLPVATMPNWRRRYDRHSQRLFISERLSPFDQLLEIAMEAALVRMQVMIGAETEGLKLSSSEAKRIARFELARYAAQALMMPYRQFRDAAVRARYDIDVLRSRFGVSFQQAASRLTTLQRQGNSALPFFLMEIDHAGNRLRMAGAEGFPVRFGGQCPKLPVYSAFAQAGQVLVEPAELPDGSAFLTIARTLEGPHGAFNERPRRTAILLGCSLDAGAETIYGANSAPSTEIGPACRLCERQGCITRAEPPLTRPLGLDEMVAGLSAFDFQ
ncbi:MULTISPECIES: helix-turn-helix domain-containing protein [Brucella]|uniref:XRE family transcriptional regulator n=1 Tax=Brucella pituitosa TaxID=571256 RepID=A0A643EYT3_9HYPH|nr:MULTISPECIES: XRE family transcriptional regulator [Brucella]PQZ50235.1 XRE family transcriptional regulator [Ochrobactrum sp. MYb19]PRA68277.1 XRE family transcriptional regulator [Ochrobactrum sp. MYb18]PRA74496.1 XRE family transcriptional regulator [Brucella thiophenivorans]PRA90527.1 XRE family transcriptional regulator [Ochrobactrum sp. MYb14]PRA95978.1 XRE family transcriptional regulator [Ochrobactrum sp. MYb15]